MKLVPLVYSLAIIFGTTYYVRPDGGTPAQCNGKKNAPYPGTGLAQPCALRSLHDATRIATYTDRIELLAGANFDTSSPFTFGDKGPPPTNTDADYIVVTTTDPTSTPTKLLNYSPSTHTPVTSAEAARMPKLRTTSSLPVIDFARGAKYWKLKGLEITNVDTGVIVPRLISGDINGQIQSYDELPRNLILEEIFARPVEETGAPPSSLNINRTVMRTMMLNASNVQITRSSFQGFGGRYKYDFIGQTMTTSNIEVTLGENWRVTLSFLQAWTYAFFGGGGGVPRWAVTAFGTVSNCVGNPTTECDFSNTTGLNVGDPFGVLVSTSTSQNKWAGSYVASITGQRVKFSKPLCQSFDGGNSCTAQNGTPANGDRVQWNGKQPINFIFERNTWDHPIEWNALLGECGGKGLLELKSLIGGVFNGNVFRCTGFTNTVRNQNGDFPWASISDTKIINNYFERSNNVFVAFCQDALPTRRSRNILWHNNLIVGAELNQHFRGGTLSGNWTNCDSPTITHNTVAWTPAGNNFTNFGVMNSPTIRDNILPMGQNACFAGGTTIPMPNCWVNGDIRNNVLVNVGTTEYEQEWWLGPWPNQIVFRSWSGVGFVNPTQFLDANGDYRLKPDSAIKGKGSDGKDPGADVDAVMLAVFGGEPLPSPTATPTPVPSPTVQPTPQPTPQPSPTPLPTPQPTPLPTPTPDIPTGQVMLSGKTFYAIDGGPFFQFTKVVLTDSAGIRKEFFTSDGTYSFVVAPGSYQLHIEQSGGYNASPGRIYVTNANETMAGLGILNFTIGPDSWFQQGADHCVPGGGACPPGQPTPTPTPTPTVTPTPTPTPLPTPQPTPTATPLPSPSPTPTATPTPEPTPLPTPSPTPTPLPACSISVPDTITLPRNSSTNVMVTVTTGSSPLPIVVRAIPATGQVVVSPVQRSAAVSGPLSFLLRSKNNSSSVRWESICGTKTTQVLIR